MPLFQVEKLSETFITNQINAGQEEEDVEEPPAEPVETDVVSPESHSEAEPENVEVAKQTTPEKRRSSRTKPVLKLLGKTPELTAL
jgi:hypothetical protein